MSAIPDTVPGGMRDRPKRVLVADDDLAFRILVEQALQNLGYEVECVADGDAALRRVVERPPDLVLLDNVMPGLAGTDVCRAMHEQMGDSCPSIVMVTGCDGESDIAAAFDSGAVDYLLKPVNWALLKFRIASWLETGTTHQAPPAHTASGSLEIVVNRRGDILELRSPDHPAADPPPSNIDEILEEAVAKQVVSLLRRVLRTRESRQDEFDTEIGGQRANWTLSLDARGRDKVGVSIFKNEGTNRNQAQLFHLAYVDAATGLPNRHLFQQTLKDRLDHARFRRRKLAVICMTIATPTGQRNATLRYVERLGALGKSLNIAWMDESLLTRFELPGADSTCVASLDSRYIVAIVDDAPGTDWLDALLRRTEALAGDGVAIYSGIAQYPQDGDSIDLLIDSAIYATESNANSSLPAGQLPSAASIQHHEDLEEELLEALRTEQLTLFYQPRVDLQSGHVIAAEALIRWLHPLFGAINGAQLFERLDSGVAVREVADWAVVSACQQARDWLDAGLALPVTINVADEQLVDGSFVDWLLASVDDLGLPPDKVELEVSEATIDRIAQVEKQLAELRGAGFGLVVDDFASSKTQLQVLSQLSPTAFKIDGRQSRTNSGNVIAIARAIAASCEATLIAKHIETATDMKQTRDIGCQEAQGFHICQPLSGHDLGEFVATLALSDTSSLDLAATT